MDDTDTTPTEDGQQDAGLPGLDLPETEQPTPAYRVLARKYRPQTFAELVGQEALVRTLTNAISSGRIAHAYMLTGIRGVGKTTTARLIARALNCVGPDGTGGPTISPCGVCEHCRAIAADRHVDVLEMDAASNTGVDDVREIIAGVRYAPATARYKVYIIDEVHMLSRNAFNALLKTLEEPPPHARFIFATTEIRKVPVTVLSRAQRFDLRRMPAELIAQQLRDIASKEQVTLDEQAAAMLARAADGSMRDGLSLFDQAISLGEGAVDQTVVSGMLGLADRAVVIDLFDKLVSGDTNAALDLAAQMAGAGAEPLTVVQDLLDFSHFVTRCKLSEQAAADPGLPESDRERGPALAAQLSVPVLTRLWQMLLAGLDEVARSPDPAAALDMLIIRLIYAAGQPTPGDLLKALRGERAADASSAAPANPPAAEAAQTAEPVARAEPIAQAGPNAEAARFTDLLAGFADDLDPEIVAHLRRDIRIVTCGDNKLEIAVSERAPANLVTELNETLAKATGQRWLVAVVDRAGGQTVVDCLKAREAEIRREVAEHPMVKDILETFEGAELEIQDGTGAEAAQEDQDNGAATG